MKLKWLVRFGITHNVFILGLVSLLNDIGSEMICPLLPLFITQNLHASTTFVGVIEGIADSGASIFKLVSGWVSDKLMIKKPIVISGYALSAISRTTIAVANAGWHVLFSRFFDRMGKGIRTSPRDSLIAVSSVEGSIGKAFGFHRAMDHAGAVIGPLIATSLMVYYSNRLSTIFWLASVPGVIAVLLIILFVSDPPSKNNSNSKGKEALRGIRLLDKPFMKFLFLVSLFSLGNSSNAFLLLKAEKTGISPSFLPILWVFMHIVKMLMSVPCGILSDKIGRKKVIVIGWLIYSSVYIGFAFAYTKLHIWLLFIIYGLFFAFTEGVERAMISDMAIEDSRGTAYGFYHFSIGITALPASIIMGALWDRVGITIAFLFGAGISLIASILFIILIKEKEKRHVEGYRDNNIS